MARELPAGIHSYSGLMSDNEEGIAESVSPD